MVDYGAGRYVLKKEPATSGLSCIWGTDKKPASNPVAAGFFVDNAMLLASALVVAASVIAFSAAWLSVDPITGYGPVWASWVGYGSPVTLCLGVFGVIWEAGMWVMS